MASITSSLFGTLAGMGSPETLLEQRVQRAYGGNRRPGDVFFNASAGAGEQLMQSTRKLFGQEDEQTRQQRKLQAIIQGVQAQTDVSTPEGLTTLADQLNMFPEFSGIALAMRQEAAKLKMDVTKNEIGNALKQAQTQTEAFKQTKFAAETEAKLREPTAKKGTLAERLVELETKKAQQPLTAPEAAELVALEKVVKIQAPKGTDLTGLAAVFGKKASEEEAKETGRQLATIEGKQQAVESLNSALGILKQGIYTGSYAEYQTTLAKKSLGVIGDIKRVENTEVFLNEVSSNVIPLLQEFGGNDSNEELKFLQRLVGGDNTLEQRSIERIINNAVKKINRGIERTAAKGQAIRQGKLPPLPQAAKTQAQTRTTKSGITYTVEE